VFRFPTSDFRMSTFDLQNRLREGDRHTLLRRLRNVSQSPQRFCTLHWLFALVRQKAGAHRNWDPQRGVLGARSGSRAPRASQVSAFDGRRQRSAGKLDGQHSQSPGNTGETSGTPGRKRRAAMSFCGGDDASDMPPPLRPVFSAVIGR